MSKRNIALCVAALSVAAALADAQTEPRPIHTAAIDTSEAAFRKLDADHDGRISALEANSDPKVAERFLQADKNHDGFLSLAEFRTLNSDPDMSVSPPPPQQ